MFASANSHTGHDRLETVLMNRQYHIYVFVILSLMLGSGVPAQEVTPAEPARDDVKVAVDAYLAEIEEIDRVAASVVIFHDNVAAQVAASAVGMSNIRPVPFKLSLQHVSV
jgi:hypothetical protein